MTEHAELPGASRDPVERLTDDVLRRPLRTLSAAERAMIRAAIKNRPTELQARMERLRNRKANDESKGHS